MFSFQQYSKHSHSKPKYPITYYKNTPSNLSSTSLHLDLTSLYNTTHHNHKTSLSKPKPPPFPKELNMSHFQTEPFIPLTKTSPLQKCKPKQSKPKPNNNSNGTSITHSQKKFQVLAGAKPSIVIQHNTTKKGNAHRTCKTLSMANLSFNNGNANTLHESKTKIEKNIRYNMLTTIKKNNKDNIYTQYEHNLDVMLNDIDTKSKKEHYDIMKRNVNEFMTMCNNDVYNVLNKLFEGYNKLVMKFSKENKVLYEKGIERQHKLCKVNKYLTKCMKQIQDKDKEIEELKNIIKNMSFGNNNCLQSKSTNNMSKDSNSTGGINSLSNENNQCMNIQLGGNDNDDIKGKSHKKVIEEFNKLNYKDLDALYFMDKVEMDSKDKVKICGMGVPNLKIESEVSDDEEEEDNTNSNMYIEDGTYEDDDGEYEEKEDE